MVEAASSETILVQNKMYERGLKAKGSVVEENLLCFPLVQRLDLNEVLTFNCNEESKIVSAHYLQMMGI